MDTIVITVSGCRALVNAKAANTPITTSVTMVLTLIRAARFRQKSCAGVEA